jgi:hypothetical protein
MKIWMPRISALALLFCAELVLAAPFFTVESAWTKETQQRVYGNGRAYNAHVFLAINYLLYETPLVVAGYLVEELTNPATNRQIEQMAAACRAYPQSWDRIACAVYQVKKNFNEDDFGLLAAPCRSYSTTFKKVFDRLGIERAWAGYKAANFTMPNGFPTMHVANVFILTGADGNIYSYVVDLAYYPQKIYPISKAAIEWHSLNGKSQELPQLL